MHTLAASDAPPSTFEGAANAVAVLMLLTEFAMLRATLSRSQVRLYALQSLLVSVLAVIVAAGRGLPELYALAGVSLALKVIAVPWVVTSLLRDAQMEITGSGAIGVASATLLSLALAGFGFFAIGSLDIRSRFLPQAALGLSASIVLVSFILMIVRRDVVSQAVGFFSLENGVSLASLVVAAGMPLIIEVAFLFDLLVAVVVFGVLMRVHHHRSASLSTASLNRLQG
ncbi:hydrogenase [Streptomyces sp. DW26H14]|uniref:hydrogenase n=1 Tax=Streptomyces sp. DW26H14 TaxID=3435395 RepID=UPI00403D733E